MRLDYLILQFNAYDTLLLLVHKACIGMIEWLRHMPWRHPSLRLPFSMPSLQPLLDVTCCANCNQYLFPW